MILGLVLPAGHPWREQATMLGTVAFDGEVQELVAASRAHIDVLLIDASDLKLQDLDQIRAYRISRPQTRIVVALGEDVQPGSPHLAALVGMGIYDLVKGPLSEALSHTPTYADAVRWTMLEDEPATHRVQVRERIVERRMAGSQRPVLIVVAGVGYGVGTTTLAHAVAQAAREQGQPVTLLDVAIMPGASRLHTPATALRAAPRGGHLPGIEIEAALRGQTGGYVVVDAGRAGESTGLPELALTTDAVLLAVAPAPQSPGRRPWRRTPSCRRPPPMSSSEGARRRRLPRLRSFARCCMARRPPCTICRRSARRPRSPPSWASA